MAIDPASLGALLQGVGAAQELISIARNLVTTSQTVTVGGGAQKFTGIPSGIKDSPLVRLYASNKVTIFGAFQAWGLTHKHFALTYTISYVAKMIDTSQLSRQIEAKMAEAKKSGQTEIEEAMRSTLEVVKDDFNGRFFMDEIKFENIDEIADNQNPGERIKAYHTAARKVAGKVTIDACTIGDKNESFAHLVVQLEDSPFAAGAVEKKKWHYGVVDIFLDSRGLPYVMAPPGEPGSARMENDFYRQLVQSGYVDLGLGGSPFALSHRLDSRPPQVA
ncbi:hypothetical protein [Streptomyces sp. NPDC090112]|uniref:hypothetical protein n=1 Tax=Streptomyces sp. NPDC090112 TaxID=3365949 RepID=UPI003824B1D6